MKVIDPGHRYELDSLDGEQPNILVFVKRVGEKYPGNVGSHPGTTTQEVLRACIERLAYVQNQIPCEETSHAGQCLLHALFLLEKRTARIHDRKAPTAKEAYEAVGKCKACGHIGCDGYCR